MDDLFARHISNFAKRRCVAGFQKLAMSTGWFIPSYKRYKFLYKFTLKYHTLLSLQIYVHQGFDGFPHQFRRQNPSPAALRKLSFWGAQHQLRQGGLRPAVDEEYRGSHFHRSKAPQDLGIPGVNRWGVAWWWFIDGLLNIDGLLMVYSLLVVCWCLYIYIYIDGLLLMYFDISWCLLLFIPNVAVTIGFQSLENRNGSLEPGTCCWVAKLG